MIGSVAKSQSYAFVPFAFAHSLLILEFRYIKYCFEVGLDPRSHTLAFRGPLTNLVVEGFHTLETRTVHVVRRRSGTRCDLDFLR